MKVSNELIHLLLVSQGLSMLYSHKLMLPFKKKRKEERHYSFSFAFRVRHVIL